MFSRKKSESGENGSIHSQPCISLDEITPLTKTSETQGDRRFFFGIQVDPICLLKTFHGTARSITTCAQGQSGSNAATMTPVGRQSSPFEPGMQAEMRCALDR